MRHSGSILYILMLTWDLSPSIYNNERIPLFTRCKKCGLWIFLECTYQHIFQANVNATEVARLQVVTVWRGGSWEKWTWPIYDLECFSGAVSKVVAVARSMQCTHVHTYGRQQSNSWHFSTNRCVRYLKLYPCYLHGWQCCVCVCVPARAHQSKYLVPTLIVV